MTTEEQTTPQCARYCGKCDVVDGYGFAAGSLGAYSIASCGRLVAFMADIDGLDEEAAAKAQARDFSELVDSGGEG